MSAETLRCQALAEIESLDSGTRYLFSEPAILPDRVLI